MKRTSTVTKKLPGFTMIEVVITIAVVAILAAVLVPLISQNINSARLARAGSDVATIGKAIVQFRQDTARWPVYEGTATRDLLYGDDGDPGSVVIPTTWSGAVASGQRLSLDYHLVQYNIGAMGASKGPSAAGTPSWNGPYLTKVSEDPWGNAYVVNARYLWDTAAGNSVHVLSAGPGDRPAYIETSFAGVIPSDSDDITFRIQ
ncbi:MAG: prepilin-type N-terminal cleavage/methylation domain-containing protein [bacterium]|nr:prepilin-type N-terminal cleavage/methylation domain-containing protein [bacterium]